MKTFIFRLTLGLVMGLSLTGCRDAKGQIENIRACIEEGRVSSRSAPGPVLAQIGNENITASDFDEYIKDIPESERQSLKDLDKRQVLLNKLIDDKFLVILARQAGILQSESYRQYMAITESSFLRQALLEQAGIFTEAEMKQYYQTHKAIFGPEVQIIAGRLVVETLDDAKRAQKLLKKGTSFEEVEKSLSLEKQDGSTGVFRVNPTDSELIKFLSGVPKGETRIRKFALGYEILKKEDEIHLPAKPYEIAKRQIKIMIENEKFSQFLQIARSSATIKVYTPALSSLDLSTSSFRQ